MDGQAATVVAIAALCSALVGYCLAAYLLDQGLVPCARAPPSNSSIGPTGVGLGAGSSRRVTMTRNSVTGFTPRHSVYAAPVKMETGRGSITPRIRVDSVEGSVPAVVSSARPSLVVLDAAGSLSDIPPGSASALGGIKPVISPSMAAVELSNAAADLASLDRRSISITHRRSQTLGEEMAVENSRQTITRKPVPKNNASNKVTNLFQNLRVGISAFSFIYPLWYIFAYYIKFPSDSYQTFCTISPRIELAMFICLRGFVLMFFVFRLRIVYIGKPNSKLLFNSLFILIVTACAFGFFQVVDLKPVVTDFGCDFEVGTIGISGYLMFMFMFAIIHTILFKKFIVQIRIQEQFSRESSLGVQIDRAAQFQDLIRNTKIGFILYTFVALCTDLAFTLVYYVFDEQIYHGPNSYNLQWIVTLCDCLFVLDGLISALSVLSTHRRFKIMLLCGLGSNSESPGVTVSQRPVAMSQFSRRSVFSGPSQIMEVSASPVAVERKS